jgi:hypothetical protein
MVSGKRVNEKFKRGKNHDYAGKKYPQNDQEDEKQWFGGCQC